MRRRFGRRRWGGGGSDDGGSRGLDAAQELGRVLRLGLVDAETLEPAGGDDVPATLGVVGIGTARDGERLVVGVAPDGGDAWLAALAVATRLAATRRLPRHRARDRGELAARRATPPGSARRDAVPCARAHRAGGGRQRAASIPSRSRPRCSARRALAGGGDRARRALFERCAPALAGLAAKHDGATRATSGGDELMLFGRVAAVLRGDDGGVALEVREPRREVLRLAPMACRMRSTGSRVRCASSSAIGACAKATPARASCSRPRCSRTSICAARCAGRCPIRPAKRSTSPGSTRRDARSPASRAAS